METPFQAQPSVARVFTRGYPIFNVMQRAARLDENGLVGKIELGKVRKLDLWMSKDVEGLYEPSKNREQPTILWGLLTADTF